MFCSSLAELDALRRMDEHDELVVEAPYAGLMEYAQYNRLPGWNWVVHVVCGQPKCGLLILTRK